MQAWSVSGNSQATCRVYKKKQELWPSSLHSTVSVANHQTQCNPPPKRKVLPYPPSTFDCISLRGLTLGTGCCATASMIRLPIWLENVWYLPTLLLLTSACCYNLWKAALISVEWLWTRQTNRPKLVPLIFGKLKLCEYTFLLWFCFVLYRSAWTRVSLFALFAVVVFSIRFLLLLSCGGMQSFLLCPPWCCARFILLDNLASNTVEKYVLKCLLSSKWNLCVAVSKFAFSNITEILMSKVQHCL